MPLWKINKMKKTFEEFEKELQDFFWKDDPPIETERRIHGGTGKGGAILFKLAIAKEVGATEEQLEKLEEKLKKELPDGFYEFDKFGLTYKG